MKKVFKYLKDIVSKIKEFIIEMEDGELHHDEPIEVDPPVKPKEEVE